MLYHYTIEITVLVCKGTTYVQTSSGGTCRGPEEVRIRSRMPLGKVTHAETKKNNKIVSHLFFVIFRITP